MEQRATEISGILKILSNDFYDLTFFYRHEFSILYLNGLELYEKSFLTREFHRVSETRFFEMIRFRLMMTENIEGSGDKTSKTIQ